MPLWHVRYDDSDEEELTERELAEVLVPLKTSSSLGGTRRERGGLKRQRSPCAGEGPAARLPPMHMHLVHEEPAGFSGARGFRLFVGGACPRRVVVALEARSGPPARFTKTPA